MSCCCRCCDRAAYAGKKRANEILKKKLVCLYRAITLALSSRNFAARDSNFWLSRGFVFLYHCVGNCKLSALKSPLLALHTQLQPNGKT